MKALLFIVASAIFAGYASAEEKTVATEDTREYPVVLFKSYIGMIKNSVGSRAYKNLYFEVKGKNVDVLENGNLSCAYFVSAILRHFNLVGEWRTTVDELVEDMKKNGWVPLSEPRPGSVIVWEKVFFRHSGERHGHVGFYVSKGLALSTSSRRKRPVYHYWKAYPDSRRPRKILAIFWHPKLDRQ